ncbi:MAG: hypothetical protein PF904_17655 [Kiritimatiellae bacterium]|nr:hypothetical protein [Kiritimatiellia bacterium]
MKKSVLILLVVVCAIIGLCVFLLFAGTDNTPAPSRLVIVNDLTPDPYSHPTTKPNSLKTKLRIMDGIGFGGFVVSVDFNGKIAYVTPDGKIAPVKNAYYHRMHDRWIMDQGQEHLKIKHAETNGNFSTSVTIPGSYGLSFFPQGDYKPNRKEYKSRVNYGKAIEEYNQIKGCFVGVLWRIFQTGTATVRFEADGFESRDVPLRFMQPSTLVILKKEK